MTGKQKTICIIAGGIISSLAMVPFKRKREEENREFDEKIKADISSMFEQKPNFTDF